MKNIIDTSNEALILEKQDRISDLVRSYSAAARAENTLQTYRASYRVWAEWCALEEIDPVPVTSAHISRFLADNADRYKVGTLGTHMAAIATLHKLAGHESPCSVRTEPIRSVWQGIQKTHGVNVRRVDPVLIEDLRLMCRYMQKDIRGDRDKAILLVGFAGAFRRSEVAALMVSDISYSSEGMRVLVRKSKTDQISQGEVVGIQYGEDPLTCPVRALKSWIAESGITEGPIFRPIDRHLNIKESAITGHSIASIIKKACLKSGLNPKTYSGHSMRAGFVTQASKNGVSDSSILKHARQQNVRTMLKYIRHATVFTDNASGKLGL